MPTVRELRTTLVEREAPWSVNPRLFDTDEIPEMTTGGSEEGLVPSERVDRVNFEALATRLAPNRFLLERRLALGIEPGIEIPDERRREIPRDEAMAEPEALPLGGVAIAVDWRNRWGWPWVTTVRDQDGCNACWAFAATALVESMVRIEHAVWSHRSEGDMHKGMGAKCAHTGNSQTALTWVAAHGLADPACFAWSPADTAYTPTSDRPGRTVRTPNPSTVGNVQDQKAWLDTVGPLVTWFTVWQDFFSYGTGVYKKQAMIGTNPNTVAGGHFMLVVGYDETNGCWIVKNSWGTGWGENGFARIAYGECDIDKYAKVGLVGTNPDPWTKRLMHGGGMVESGNGALHRNFELLVASTGQKLRHWWRDNAAVGFPWHKAVGFGNDAASHPTLTETTYHRNFESVHRTTGKRLHHWYFDQGAQQWKDGGVFGPTDVAGDPGFIQSNYGAPGNFEVVVRTADGKLNHWWRENGPPWTWHDGGRFGAKVALSAPTLLQSCYGQQGNFELVCVLDDGQMQHWWRDNDHGMVWKPSVAFAQGVKSPPVMIEGQFGAGDEAHVGNFELCVAVAGKVQHWWRYNAGDMKWRHSTTFGHDVERVVALLEGSYGFNLEVVVLRTDGKLQHYWRHGGTWHEGVVLGGP